MVDIASKIDAGGDLDIPHSSYQHIWAIKINPGERSIEKPWIRAVNTSVSWLVIPIGPTH